MGFNEFENHEYIVQYYEVKIYQYLSVMFQTFF